MKEREIKMTKKDAIVVGKGKVRKTRPRATPLDALVLPETSLVHVSADASCVVIHVILPLLLRIRQK